MFQLCPGRPHGPAAELQEVVPAGAQFALMDAGQREPETKKAGSNYMLPAFGFGRRQESKRPTYPAWILVFLPLLFKSTHKTTNDPQRVVLLPVGNIGWSRRAALDLFFARR